MIGSVGQMTGRDVWLIGALAEILLVVTLDLTVGESANFTSGFAAAGLIAAIGVGARTTAAVGVAATAAAVGTGFLLLPLSATTWALRIAFAAGGSIVGVVAAAERVKRDASLYRASRLAVAAQSVMLRPPPPRLGPYQLAARYEAATAEANLGGDFYDVAFHPTGAVVALIGDVKGHGFDAVERAAQTLAAFRLAVFACDGPEQLVRYLDMNISSALDDEEFITALILWLLGDGTAYIVSLGHPPPWIVSSSGIRSVAELEPSPPLGLPQGVLPSPLVLSEGDTVFAFTDGLTEARDSQGRFFPAEQAVQGAGSLPLGAGLGAVLEEVTAFSGGSLADDIALLAIHYQQVRPLESVTNLDLREASKTFASQEPPDKTDDLGRGGDPLPAARQRVS